MSGNVPEVGQETAVDIVLEDAINEVKWGPLLRVATAHSIALSFMYFVSSLCTTFIYLSTVTFVFFLLCIATILFGWIAEIWCCKRTVDTMKLNRKVVADLVEKAEWADKNGYTPKPPSSYVYDSDSE
jgi:hypothetical protein